MEFLGNEAAMDFLEKAAASGKASHAWLFSGPSQVGKRLAATAFASALISGGGVREKVGERESEDCQVITPRVENVRGVLKRKDISVEEIRQAISRLALYPHSGKKRILIVDDAHKLSLGAQNAILKTLEEPSSTAAIILVTDKEEKILPTIHSRCQTVRFSLCRSEQLEGFGNKEAAKMALGRPGRIHKLLADAQYLEQQQELWRKLGEIRQMAFSQKLSLAEELGADTARALEALEMWSWMVWEGARNEEGAHALLGRIEEVRRNISSTNANTRLALEALLISV